MKYEVENGRRVTESMLIERINEKLSAESREHRDTQMGGSPSIGNFYEHANELANRPENINLEAIGRELGVLAPDETLAHCTDPRSENSDRA